MCECIMMYNFASGDASRTGIERILMNLVPETHTNINYAHNGHAVCDDASTAENGIETNAARSNNRQEERRGARR